MDNIKRIGYGNHGHEIVCQNHKQGVRRGGVGGEIVVPIEYDRVKYFGHDLYMVGRGKEFGLFSTRNGELAVPVRYKTFNYGMGGGFVGFVGKHHLATLELDQHGSIREVEYDEVKAVGTDELYYIIRKDGKYGLVSYALPDQPRISFIYDSIRPISCGNRTFYLVCQGEKYGLMDSSDEDEFCLGTGGWDKDNGTFTNDGLTYDEIRLIEDGLFLMRQGTKYGLFNLYGAWFFGDEVAYDEVRRVGKKQYLIRQGTAWRVLAADHLTHPFSPSFDELRRVGDGTFWFRRGDQTGIYDPEDSIIETDGD